MSNYVSQQDRNNVLRDLFEEYKNNDRVITAVQKRNIFQAARANQPYYPSTPLPTLSNRANLLPTNVVPSVAPNVNADSPPLPQHPPVNNLISLTNFPRQPAIRYVPKSLQQDFLVGLVTILKGFIKAFDNTTSEQEQSAREVDFSLQLLNYPLCFLYKQPKYRHKAVFYNVVREISEGQAVSNFDTQQQDNKKLLKTCIKNIREMQVGKASKLLQSHVDKQKPVRDMKDDPAFLQKIVDLHPVPLHENLVFPDDFSFSNAPNIEFTEDDLFKQLKKNGQKNSANGWSSWTFELFSWALHSDSTKQVSLLFKSFFNIIVSGKCRHSDIWNTYLLTSFRKEDNSPRPIAIGDFFVRFLSKMIVEKVLQVPTVQDLLSHSQFGVGVKGGSEAIVHAISLAFDKISTASDETESEKNSSILSVDQKNAFNSISRQAILDSLIRHCPVLVKYFIWSYGKPTNLLDSLGRFICKSNEGARQGDPLGPLLFSLGIGPILLKIRISYPSLDLYAYLDDIFMHGKTSVVEEAFSQMASLFENINLFFNLKKCVHLTNTDTYFSSVPVHFPTVSLQAIPVVTSGIKVLGMPVGSPEYVCSFSHNLMDKYTRIAKYVEIFDSPDCYVLTKLCVNSCPNYLTRCVRTELISSAIGKFDKIIDGLVATIAGVSFLYPRERKIRDLPCKLGGLGISAHCVTAPSAWSASFFSAVKLFQTRTPRVFDSIMLKKDDYKDFDDMFLKQASQRDLSLVNYSGIHKDFLSTIFDRQTKATFLSASAPGTSNFLISAYTNSSSEIGINAEDYKEGVRYRLLILPYSDYRLHKCNCVGQRDSYHIYRCKDYAYYWGLRHDLTRDALCRLVKAVKPNAFVNIEQSLSRFKSATSTAKASDNRADVSYNENADQKHLDVSYSNPTSEAAIKAKSDSIPLVSAILREKEKNRKYELFLTHDMFDKFSPFVLETTGRLGTSALKIIDHICKLDRLDFCMSEQIRLARVKFMNTVNNISVIANANVARLCREAVFRR
jgi:hypothetical protein